MKRLIIVGGGITGLAAAYRLKTQADQQDLSLDLQLLEASPRLGGTLHSMRKDGFLLEGGPDCFLSQKRRGVELCEELGLHDELIATQTQHARSFVVRAGQLHPVPEGFYLIAPSQLRPFLMSPLLSWPGKWRVLAESLIPAHPQSDESLASFVRRRLGKEALDHLAQPLLGGIYAADPETLSLRSTFPQFLDMEKKYGSVLVGLKKIAEEGISSASGARYKLFVSLKNGMQTLVDQLEKQLAPETIQRECSVLSIRHRSDSDSSWELLLNDGRRLEADGVCLALPAYSSAGLLRALNPTLGDLLMGIPYTDAATLNFAFRKEAIAHPMEGFGFVTPWVEKRVVLACTFVQRKFSGRTPPGHALLRAFVGGALQSHLLDLDEAELQERVLKDLNDLLGIQSPPLFSVINRWKRAMPQYLLGHLQRILTIEETLLGYPGLTLAGNWLHGVGIPDCIESGERAADTLIEHIQKADVAVR